MTSIEDLNKTQLILLTLLVSFVSSIATGIITTSLLAEAPVSVTQTINRVVERTIETVAPASTSGRTPVLSPEDRALLGAVSQAMQATVEIREDGAATSTPGIMGVIVSSNGLIVSAREGISATSTYYAILSDNTTIPLVLVRAEEGDDTAVFRIEEKAEDEEAGAEE